MLKYLFVIFLAFANGSCNKKDDPAGNQGSNPPTALPIDKIALPTGFHIAIFSENVPGARSLAVSPNGTVFVSTHENEVFALPDKDHNGVADTVIRLLSGLHAPNGIAFHNGSLYVGEISRILKYDNIEKDLTHPPSPIVVYDKFPTETHHGWKYMAFGPDNKLYVATGSPCNVCEEDYSRYGNIVRMNPDGSGWELFAKGIRNTVGFDWHPLTHKLWFTDNGRDNLGDDIPNDELNLADSPGMHFGFPYCHQGDLKDPEFSGHDCSEFTPPVLKLGAHVAALGMRFYTGSMFPSAYKNAIFIAQHGSWNRTVKAGYRVMAVTLDGNRVKSYEPFATGWLQGGNEWGRPVDVMPLQDGSLLISDDKAGAVYRVTYK
jgi:glucose/arabinose dehydrogenase